ncbi:MAG TPA: hypothetical protein VKB67_11430 [Rhizomicrobium sp.]|nr:hypothetical protein [Rhizomicrobium sp.]
MSSVYRASAIVSLIEAGRDGAPALSSSECATLTQEGLRELMRRTVTDLNAMGRQAGCYPD